MLNLYTAYCVCIKKLNDVPLSKIYVISHRVTPSMGKFWDKQPMALCQAYERPGTIATRTISNVSTDPVRLPLGYSWTNVSFNINDSNMSLSTIKKFLDNHYISDHDGKFRLQYSIDFIKDFLHQGHPDWNAVII